MPSKNIRSHRTREKQLVIKYKSVIHIRTQRREHLLAHSEEHTPHNLKKYTGMYSSYTAKEKCTRTQRGAHTSQFEKIYRHVQFAHSEGKMYSHTARGTQLTI